MASETLSEIIYRSACVRASHVLAAHELNFDLSELTDVEQPRLVMSITAVQLTQTTFDSLAILHSQGAQLCILINSMESKVPGATLAALGTLDLRLFAIDDTTHNWREIRSDTPTPLHTHIWCVPSEIALTISAILHSSGLGGAERTHVEFVQDVIGTGILVNTIIPEPDGGIGAMLRAVGSSVTALPAATWWTPPKKLMASTDYAAQHAKDVKRDFIPRARIDVIDALRPDLVLTRTLVSPQGAFAAAALGIPHVWDVSEFGDRDHDFELPFSASQMGQVFETLSDGVIFHSRALRDYFIPLSFGSSDTKVRIEIAAPRVPDSEIEMHRVTQEQRKKDSDPLQPFVVGIVAALHEGKGHTDAIQAAALLKQQHKRVEFRFIGEGFDLDHHRLTKMIAEKNVSDRIHFVGQKLTMDKVYEDLDAVAVTSRSEGLGRVAFEATAMGLPVIYAQSAGLLDYMSPENGVAYTPGDPIALVAAIVRLMEDPELGSQLVAHGQKRFASMRNNPARAQDLHDWLKQTHINFAPPPLRQLIGRIVSAAALMTSMDEHQTSLKRVAQLTAELRNALGIAVTRQERIDALTEQLAVANEIIASMQASRSWRWTKPLRRSGK